MPVKQSLYEEWLHHAKLSIKLLTLSQWVSCPRLIQLAHSNDKIQINFTYIYVALHTLSVTVHIADQAFTESVLQITTNLMHVV